MKTTRKLLLPALLGAAVTVSTATPTHKARDGSSQLQTTVEPMAKHSTPTRNGPAQRSAKAATSGFKVMASRMRAMICAYRVSGPNFSTRNSNAAP